MALWAGEDAYRRYHHCKWPISYLILIFCFGNALSVAVYALQGFDEFMNLTMDDAEEVYVKEGKRRQVGE